jgi:hypothetical protein
MRAEASLHHQSILQDEETLLMTFLGNQNFTTFILVKTQNYAGY